MNDRVITVAGRVVDFRVCAMCRVEYECKVRLACHREEPPGTPSIHQAVDQFAADLAAEIHGHMLNHAPDKVPAMRSPEFQKLVVVSARNVADRYALSHEWRCFHCDEVFTDRAAAAEHFGADQGETPACKLNQVEGGMVTLLREAHGELRRYRDDDHAMARTFHALGAEHYTKEREAEEKGYALALEQVGKPLAIAINLEAHRIEHDWNAADVAAVRRNLIISVNAVGLGHLIKAP